MAYTIIRDEWNKYQLGREITAVLDAAADLETLGAAFCPGSVAIVADKGAPVYMLNASGAWKEI